MTDMLQAEVERRIDEAIGGPNEFVKKSIAVAVTVEMIEKERKQIEEPPYPYLFRKHIQRLNMRLHRMSMEFGRVLVNLRGWKQRYKSSKGSLMKRAEAAERREELAHVSAAQALAYRDEARKALVEYQTVWAWCKDTQRAAPKGICPVHSGDACLYNTGAGVRVAQLEKALAEHREKWGHRYTCKCKPAPHGAYRDLECAPAPEEKP